MSEPPGEIVRFPLFPVRGGPFDGQGIQAVIRAEDKYLEIAAAPVGFNCAGQARPTFHRYLIERENGWPVYGVYMGRA